MLFPKKFSQMFHNTSWSQVVICIYQMNKICMMEPNGDLIYQLNKICIMEPNGDWYSRDATNVVSNGNAGADIIWSCIHMLIIPNSI